MLYVYTYELGNSYLQTAFVLYAGAPEPKNGSGAAFSKGHSLICALPPSLHKLTQFSLEIKLLFFSAVVTENVFTSVKHMGGNLIFFSFFYLFFTEKSFIFQKSGGYCSDVPGCMCMHMNKATVMYKQLNVYSLYYIFTERHCIITYTIK